MKTNHTLRIAMLCSMLIILFTANCKDKKTADESQSTAQAEKTESVIQVAAPPFNKFVVVIAEESVLYQKPDTNSPNLVRWIESDCESDFCESFYKWSGQPGKEGFELSTDMIAPAGEVFPVLGEEGQFYKVYTINLWCDIESAYIPKADVGDIECAPITAEQLESDDEYFKCYVGKDGKYKDIVFLENFDELEGESLNVGVLTGGVVATPVVNRIDIYLNTAQKEDFVINQADEDFTISYGNRLAADTQEGENPYQLDPKKLSAEQITQIVDLLSKKKVEYIKYMYHFPALGLQEFYYQPR